MQHLKLNNILLLLLFYLNIQAADSYITKSDLNLRSGAGKNYKSVVVIAKGDTVKLLEKIDDYWVKIQYQDKVGYSAKQFLQSAEMLEEKEDDGGHAFLTFLISLAVIIGISVGLTRTGRKYRRKPFAAFISFFFGSFGFQKYYLGEKNKGTLSILFCWTFIPSLIGLIDFIKLTLMSDANFNVKYNLGKFPKRKSSPIVQRQKTVKSYSVSTNRQEFKNIDSSIIDVHSEKLDLAVERSKSDGRSYMEPPYWEHSYVYSYDEIKYATKAQREYYFYLKNKVLNKEFVDIRGYTNYAFILYFDFLHEYQGHRDIKLLEEQFKLIGQICPKTKSYTLRLLQDELRKRTDSYSIETLRDLEEPTYQFEHGYSDYDPDAYKLGKLYKEKLGLNTKEVELLNKFWNPSNVFLSIEGCCIAVIMQYLFLLKELGDQLKFRKKTLEGEISYFRTKLTEYYSRKFGSQWGYDRNYYRRKAESDIYLMFFKQSENSVRESFGHKRKISDSSPFNNDILNKEFEERLGNLFSDLIDKCKDNVGIPDIETQIELNAQNVNRWKIEFDNLKETFQKEEINKFVEGILHLEETNQKNPNIENIFFDASKFIAKYDKVQSLKYYAQYIYYDLKSKKFDNRELTTTIQKSLFKTQEQINDFKRIITDLIETSDIKKALDEISKIYIPKRKKIKLDKSEIKEVEQKHDGTVELLNEYLETEQEEILEVDNFEDEETEIDIVSSNTNNSILVSDVRIGKIQEELIKRIVSNSFEILQDEVDKFATENGMFKNQLIDSINEACEGLLDGEALIEEDDDKYTIEESYYKEIAL